MTAVSNIEHPGIAQVSAAALQPQMPMLRADEERLRHVITKPGNPVSDRNVV